MPAKTEIIEIAKDAVGANGYQRATEDIKQYPTTTSTEILVGIESGAVQVIAPLTHQRLEELFYGPRNEKPRVRELMISEIIDVMGIFAAAHLLNLSQPETVPAAVGVKVAYNAAASALPRIVRSARARFKTT